VKRKPKNPLALAALAGLLSAGLANAAPLVDLQILGSTSGTAGTYGSVVPAGTPGSQIYYEVVAQSAPSGTTNTNTNTTAGKTPNGKTDSFSSIPYITLSGLGSGTGTFASSAIASRVSGGVSQDPGTSGSSSLNFRISTAFFDGINGNVNDDSQMLLLSGTYTVGTGPSSISGSYDSGSATPSGSIRLAGSLQSITAATETTSGDPILGYTPLTFSLAWSGSISDVWDVNTTANFTGQNYTDGKIVSFGDYAADGTTAVQHVGISIANGGVSPASVSFINSIANTYQFTDVDGTNGIGGAASVSVTGGGTIIFSSPNNYSGGTFISAGTLKAASGSLNSTGAITIGTSGKLYVGDGSSSVPSALATGAQTWVGGGSYCAKVDGNGTADLLAIGTAQDSTGGALTLSGASLSTPFTIVAQAGDIALGTASEKWELAAFNSTITGYIGTLPSRSTPSVPVDSQFILDTSALSEPSSDFSLSLVELSSGHDALYLNYTNYTAAPEPGTAVLILVGAMQTLLGRRRRRFGKAAGAPYRPTGSKNLVE
jgi:autotransporter-associated beta strand protein